MTSVFDSFAVGFDKWFDTPEGRMLFLIELEAVRSLIRGLEKPFLEIGVGTGRFASELEIEFGVDTSIDMLAIARSRGIITEAASGEHLPFRDGSFGGVFIIFTLCFAESPGAVLREAGRVLIPGGAVVVGIINRESPWGELYLSKKEGGHPIYKHAHFYTPAEVAEMIEKSVFDS